MANLWNLLYLGEIYMGTPLQKLYVIWDTGSGGYLVRSSLCTDLATCSGDKFVLEDSSSFFWQ